MVNLVSRFTSFMSASNAQENEDRHYVKEKCFTSRPFVWILDNRTFYMAKNEIKIRIRAPFYKEIVTINYDFLTCP